MKVGIVGAGFVGLAAAYKLASQGHEVVVLESGSTPGGLAAGFSNFNWKWSLEKHYHHLFTSDIHFIDLAKEIKHPLIKISTKTSIFYKENIYQLDTLQSLFRFKLLPFSDRLRTALVLAYLKISPFQNFYEKITAENFLKNSMGKKSWQILWYPLLSKKFANYFNQIAISWFWARIKKRTKSLMYPEGGFKLFALNLANIIEKNKGKIFYNTKILKIISINKAKIELIDDQNRKYIFDKVICTLPTPQFIKITKGLPKSYLKKYEKLAGIGALNLLLVLKKPFLNDGTYWLNINYKDFPFLNVVEHTNFIPSKNYGNNRILYIGNYLKVADPFFGYSEKQLLKEYLPYLKRINQEFKMSDIKKVYLSKAFFAQPIITKNYSELLPPFKTPIPNLYLANIQQVYPWDRGTNYAVELGNKIAKIVGTPN